MTPPVPDPRTPDPRTPAPHAAGADRRRDTIDVAGARTDNLREVSPSIPKGRLVAFTGASSSGSGKTSLAVDTLHSEARLRHLEGLSPFVRQYITQRNRLRG
ncbi:hypothetical protein [Kitasatospora sp. NPDC091276]|uniref:hypothetical protein n=1 Tax=unclassified Kitasatospora TaxID=2633591 RepID=UPI003440954C